MNDDIQFLHGFAWPVLNAFASAVAECRFCTGDLLYDSPKAYEGRWGEAREHLRYILQVKSNTGIGTSQSAEGGSTDVFDQNWASPVEVSLTAVKEESKKEIRATQGHLYTLLWRGMPTDQNWSGCTIRKPLRTAEAHQVLEKVALRCVERAGAKGKISFLMAHDPVSPISANKAKKVRQVLQERFRSTEKSFSPAEVDAASSDDYAPTIRFELFSMKGENQAVHDALKSVLYVPAKDRKTNRDAFKLRAHGLLIEG